MGSGIWFFILFFLYSRSVPQEEVGRLPPDMVPTFRGNVRWDFLKKGLDVARAPCYNMHLKSTLLKYALAFLLGMVTTYYVAPPTPSVEVDDLTKQRIVFEVVELLEVTEYDLLAAKRQAVKEDTPWWR